MKKLFANMRNKRKNNKGFSLVELIVVIAIMAILSVTLAPKLTHYLDKAKQASDKEVLNTIATAIQTSVIDNDMLKEAVDEYSTSGGVDIVGNLYIYDSDDEKYEAVTDTSGLTSFENEIMTVIGSSFTIKSSAASSKVVSIKVYVSSVDEYWVKLTYNNNATMVVSGPFATSAPTGSIS